MSPPIPRRSSRIAQWRSYLRRRRAFNGPDVDELEAHLRDQVAALIQAGLGEDESFLVAVKRMGSLDALSREFAREHSERLWKQLVVAGDDEADDGAQARREAFVAFGLAVAAAVALKVPALFGLDLASNEPFFARNASLFVLPFLTAFFVWKRRITPPQFAWMAAPFIVAAIVMNVYPFARGTNPVSYTEALGAIHLPIALWLVVGIAYAGGRWSRGDARMDFVRFSGELLIYYVLIALGGFVLTAFTLMMFEAIGLDAEWMAEDWLVPCGAAGAVLIGSWLVEAKQSVIENMAPVLTRLFTPLFTIVLLLFLATMAWTRRPIDIQREVLIAFDLLLVLVVCLVLYSASARAPDARPNLFDALQVVLIVSALIVDLVALAAIASRISEFGFTPNRVAALGENLILLVNLSWSAYLYGAFLRGGRPFHALESWQTSYLPVYSLWAAFVVVVFPILFAFA